MTNLIAAFLQRKFANVRERLNTEYPHFIPLDLKTFESSLRGSLKPESDVELIFNGFVNFLKSRHKKSIPISKVGKLTKTEIQNGPYLVYANNPANIIGALYPTYNSAYGAGFRNYLNKSITKIISTPFGSISSEEGPISSLSTEKYDNTNISPGYDVGHMFAGISAEYGDTPLSYKLKVLQNAVSNIANSKLVLARNVGINKTRKNELDLLTKKIELALKELEAKANLGIQITANLDKSITNNLAKIKAVIIVPQGRLENQYEFGTLVESAIERDIAKVLVNLKFSPSLVEGAVDTIVSKINGEKPKSITASSKTITIVKNPVKTKVKPTVEKPLLITPKINTSKYKKQSIVSLETLLRTGLALQIQKNMGTGSSTNVLNYRTGRFANTASIERVLMSRTGMLTVFYNYMKYPYATFSEGGRQEYPKSRDPKLLISKSIREIGASLVGNRMRAVLA